MLFAAVIKASFSSASILKLINLCYLSPRHYHVYAQYITIQISSPRYAAPTACKAARYSYMWHRSKTAEPGTSRYDHPDIICLLSRPARPCGLSAMKMPLCALGVVPVRVAGVYLRVGGPLGPFTSVITHVQRSFLFSLCS